MLNPNTIRVYINGKLARTYQSPSPLAWRMALAAFDPFQRKG